MGRLFVGAGQFLMVWAAWVSYVLALVYACSGLTKAVMRATLGVDTWAAWQPWGKVEVEDLSDGTLATVLGVMGCFVVLAAIGHLVVMLTRGAALVILTATAPIAAAGLVSQVGQSWFWKSVRWTHAAALTPPLMALVIGVGAKLSTAVVTQHSASLSAAIGTAVPAVMLLLVSTVAPLALFKLLAFVDPGTSSGAAMRQGMSAVGGVQGLLGGASPTGGGSSAASQTDSTGRAGGESTGEDATSARFAQSAGGFLGTVGGGLGGLAAKGLGAAASVGATAAAVGADTSNQMGVGHNSYVPDFTSSRGGQGQSDNTNVPEVHGDNPGRRPGGGAPPAPSPPTPVPALSAVPSAGPAAGAGAVVAPPPLVARPPPSRSSPSEPTGGHAMSHVYSDYSRARIGFLFGLSLWQLSLLAVGALPVLFNAAQGAWVSAGAALLAWVVVAALVVTPVRGRSATAWLLAALAHAAGSLTGWTRFTAHAARGAVGDLGTVDLPGVLSAVQVHDGPPAGPAQRRTAVIQNHAARTWAVTGAAVHPGIGMSSPQQRDRYGDGLSALLEAASRTELIDEIILMVRTVPEDGAERDQWITRHRRGGAPHLARTVNDDLQASLTGASVRTEVFVTVVVPESRPGQGGQGVRRRVRGPRRSPDRPHLGGGGAPARRARHDRRVVADLSRARRGVPHRVRARGPGRDHRRPGRRRHQPRRERARAVGDGRPVRGGADRAALQPRRVELDLGHHRSAGQGRRHRRPGPGARPRAGGAAGVHGVLPDHLRARREPALRQQRVEGRHGRRAARQGQGQAAHPLRRRGRQGPRPGPQALPRQRPDPPLRRGHRHRAQDRRRRRARPSTGRRDPLRRVRPAAPGPVPGRRVRRLHHPAGHLADLEGEPMTAYPHRYGDTDRARQHYATACVASARILRSEGLPDQAADLEASTPGAHRTHPDRPPRHRPGHPRPAGRR